MIRGRLAAKHLGTAAGFAVGFLLLFYVIGGFSVRQSLVLAVAAEFARETIDQIRRRLDFDPFEVIVKPRWHDILDGQKVLPPEGVAWGEWFQQGVNAAGPAAVRLVNEGLRLTFLARQTAFIHQLDMYSGLSDVRIKVLNFGIDDRDGIVRLYMRTSRVGYELGVITPASMRHSATVWDDKERVPLATIPRSLIRQFLWRDSPESIDMIKRDLTNGGWTLREPDPMIGMPLRIEHELVEVSLESL